MTVEQMYRSAWVCTSLAGFHCMAPWAETFTSKPMDVVLRRKKNIGYVDFINPKMHNRMFDVSKTARGCGCPGVLAGSWHAKVERHTVKLYFPHDHWTCVEATRPKKETCLLRWKDARGIVDVCLLGKEHHATRKYNCKPTFSFKLWRPFLSKGLP